MKKVICVYNGIELGHSKRLTIGKIYDVIEFIEDNLIVIKDDQGDEANYIMVEDKVWFEDAKPYIREDKLNDILNG
jgi:rRNA processing protein Gar1